MIRNEPVLCREEAAWFPYATYYSAENHTGFYCLPEIGDYVKMRFSSTQEEEATIVGSTRFERDREQIADHLNTKMFRTNHQKELALTQTGVTLSGKEKNLLIRFDQDKGVTISSHNQLEIRSKGNLNLQAGRKVSITAKKAVDIKCGQKSRLVLNENETSGMIHIFGTKVSKEAGKGQIEKIDGGSENLGKEPSVLPTKQEKFNYIFGVGGNYYQTEKEALNHMKTIKVNIWRYNSETKQKYSSSMQITVNEKLADVVQKIFAEIYKSPEQFPIDPNTTGAYCWRNTPKYPNHQNGLAIDINWDAII